MKAIVLIFAILTIQLEANVEIQEKWINFKKQHKKVYASPLEELKRSSIFFKNLKEIELHNEASRNNKISYQKGLTKFADWTKEEFKEYVNKINGLKRLNTALYKRNIREIPDSKDWRNFNAVTPVKNQGELGSSITFGVTGSIESQVALIRHNLISLSEKNVADCANDTIFGAFSYVKEHGIMSEEDYPKTGDNSCKTDESKIVTKLQYFFELTQGDEELLLQVLDEMGPVLVAIDATEELQLYTKGIFDDDKCSSLLVNHVMLAVGFGSEDGLDYYILKNSWGENWGESGYVRLLRNKRNKCGIATMAYIPVIPFEIESK